MSNMFSRTFTRVITFQILGLILTYTLNILLTRQLSLLNYGTFNLILTSALLLAPIASLGLVYAALRYIPITPKQEQHSTLSLFRKIGYYVIVLSSLIIGLIWWAFDSITHINSLNILAAFLLPLIAIFELQTNLLRATDRIVLSAMLQRFIRPLLLLALTVTLSWILPLNLLLLMTVYVVIYTLLFVGQWYLLSQTSPTPIDTFNLKQIRTWLGTGLRLLGIQSIALLVLRAPLLTLGAVRSIETVAIFSIIMRVMALASFGTEGAGYIYASQVAIHIEQQNWQQLAHHTRQVIGYSLLFVLIVGIPIIYYYPLLPAIFGAEYTVWYEIMLLAFLVEILRAIRNPFTYLLNLSGHENLSLKFAGIISLIGLPLMIGFMALFGMQGGFISLIIIEIMTLSLFAGGVRSIIGKKAIPIP